MDYALLMKLAAHIVAVVEDWHANVQTGVACEDPFKAFRLPVVSAGCTNWVYLRFNAIGHERIQICDHSGKYASTAWVDFCTLDLALC